MFKDFITGLALSFVLGPILTKLTAADRINLAIVGFLLCWVVIHYHLDAILEVTKPKTDRTHKIST